MEKLVKKIWDALSSTWLAVAVLLLLLLLTLLGTLEQADSGLYQVQKKYFESLFLVEWLFGVVPVPLPGVYLLLIALCVNLIAGAIAKVRFTPAKIGVFIAHLGVVFLLAGGFLTYRMSERGYLYLHVNESASEYVSNYDHEIAIRADSEGPTARELLIPEQSFQGANRDEPRVFRSEELPFDVEVTAWVRHCRPWPAQRTQRPATAAVDGFVLDRLPEPMEEESALRGTQVALVEKAGGKRTDVLLWAGPPEGERVPYVFPVGGKRYAIDLRKARSSLPFSVRLEKAETEYHPRTRMPSAYTTEVTKIDGSVNQRVRIVMNEPLRHKGVTFYNSQVGRDAAGPYAVLAVVRNPADDLPLYATLVISLGLLIQFCRRLNRYIAETRVSRAEAPVSDRPDGAGRKS